MGGVGGWVNARGSPKSYTGGDGCQMNQQPLGPLKFGVVCHLSDQWKWILVRQEVHTKLSTGNAHSALALAPT